MVATENSKQKSESEESYSLLTNDKLKKKVLAQMKQPVQLVTS